MTQQNTVVAFRKGTSELVRPRYSAGLLLRDDDLRLAVDYTRQLSRLLFRSLFGCGVICGLDVEARLHCGALKVLVHDGVALDCHGDPIHVPEKTEVSYDVSCDEKMPTKLWVLIRHDEKCCAPRSAMCAEEEDEVATVCTREKDGFEIRLTGKDPNCACGCLKGDKQKESNVCKCVDPELECYKPHYDGKCGCTCGECTDCDCEWVILARLDYGKVANETEPQWHVDHLFRRFVRPVLIRDPKKEPPKEPDKPSEQDVLKAAFEKAKAEQEKLNEEKAKLAMENAALADEKARLAMENIALVDEKAKLIAENAKLLAEGAKPKSKPTGGAKPKGE